MTCYKVFPYTQVVTVVAKSAQNYKNKSNTAEVIKKWVKTKANNNKQTNACPIFVPLSLSLTHFSPHFLCLINSNEFETQTIKLIQLHFLYWHNLKSKTAVILPYSCFQIDDFITYEHFNGLLKQNIIWCYFFLNKEL